MDIDDVRERLHIYMNDHDRSDNSIAVDIGISHTSFVRFLKDEYYQPVRETIRRIKQFLDERGY